MSEKSSYGLTAVCIAAGASESVVRSWFDRGLIPCSTNDRAADGRATPREISFNTALQIAVATELSSLGFQAKRATRLALAFSDIGKSGRLPAELYSDGKTLLVAYPKRETAQVIKESELKSIFAHGGVSSASVAIVDLNAIYRTTAARLGVALVDRDMN
ncbi:hypothetical protein [Ochrobactrum sp. S1502_03]|uniref:hypothetical protein n=1 Tax=Ochrobactrum sp. S1502_03 TaxID=3108451 RepID=UPI0037C933FF